MKKIIHLFSIKNITDIIEYFGKHSWFVFITATILMWYGKIESSHWMFIALGFMFYNLIKKHIVPLIQIGGAYTGVKQLDITATENDKE
jgi:hypothetical protein